MLNIKSLKIFIVFSLLFIFSVSFASAATGFLNSPLWITPEFPKEGDVVKVSAAFHNGETQTLEGRILFYDKGVLLGEKDINVLPGDAVIASVTTNVGAGDHIFSSKIEKLQKVSSSGETSPFYVQVDGATMSKIFVGKTTTYSTEAASGETSSGITAGVNSIKNKIEENFSGGVVNSSKNIFSRFDNWRIKMAGNLIDKKLVYSKKVSDFEENYKSMQKKGEIIPKTTSYFNRPLIHLEYYGILAIAAVFSQPIMFYIAGVLLLFFVLRFVWRRIRRRHRR